MNFKHDLAMMSKQEMEEAGIIVPSDWNDYKICMKYFELQQRWFDSSVSYNIFYFTDVYFTHNAGFLSCDF